MKDLGQLAIFLGIQVLQQANGLALTQEHYALDILRMVGMEDYKPILNQTSTKMLTNFVNHMPYNNPTFYRQLIGALQYLTITQPNLSFVIKCLCQYMHNHLVFHFRKLKRVLKYIKGTTASHVLINSYDLQLMVYSDSNWGGDTTDQKSTTRLLYIPRLNSHLLSSKETNHCHSLLHRSRISCTSIYNCKNPIGSQSYYIDQLSASSSYITVM